MFKNYLKIAFRNIFRHKGYSTVNVVGLSVALACIILISMIVWNEVSFDNFHSKKDRIFRVYIEEKQAGNTIESAPVMIPFAPLAKADIPEIEYAVRISYQSVLSTYNEKKFYESSLFVDDKFFSVFSFPFVTGSPGEALQKPNTVVITEKAADKYFGKENPVGKSIVFNGKDHFLVTGVIKDLPFNSHIRSDFFASFNTFNESNFPRMNSWGSFSSDFTYIQLKPGINPLSVEKKLNNIVTTHAKEAYHNRYDMKMQKLTDIHFSDLAHDNAVTAPVIFLYILIIIGLFILLIAVINFINLSTARASKRYKEIGIRKVSGANRSDLIAQFLSETSLFLFISLFIALIIVALFIPEVNSLLNQNLSFSVFSNFYFITMMAAILIVTVFFAGLYPAFVLSRPIPAVIMKHTNVRKGSYSFRAVLVVIQFAISIFLIIGTMTVFKQIDFMLSKNLGFPKEQIVVLNNNDKALQQNGIALKQALLNSNFFESASFSSGTPGSNATRTSDFTPEGGNEKDEIMMQIIDVDYDFLNTFALKMKSGRFFSREFSTDTSEAYILNETAVKKLGLKDPVGKRLAKGSYDVDAIYSSVIGVIPDFNYGSLEKQIAPTVFRLVPNGGRFLSLRLKTDKTTSALNYAMQVHSSFSPAYPFDFFFIKERFENYNRASVIIGKLLGFFSSLAIILSCIGVLGLISYSAQQKSKEIGVRKVLGSTVSGIIFLLCKEFVKWVLIANLIIYPIAYLAAQKFLEHFAYRTGISFQIFGLTFILSIVITLITISYHAIKAATANPVESLRYE